MADRGYVTLDTDFEEIHDGSTFCFIRCSAAVQLADTATATGDKITVAPANENYLLPMGKATFAKVASFTATCYINR